MITKEAREQLVRTNFARSNCSVSFHSPRSIVVVTRFLDINNLI